MSLFNYSDTGKGVAHEEKELWVEDCRDQLYPRVTIDVLPDDALLKVFHFYVDGDDHEDVWHTLVHVCRRWRRVVFASPLHLNLRLLCTKARSMKTMLDIWPAFPIVIRNISDDSNIKATLKSALRRDNRHRVHEIDIKILSLYLGVMKKPLPGLTHLKLDVWHCQIVDPFLPDSFLRGSAPRLRTLSLCGIAIQGLHKVLRSAHDLVKLDLSGIPCYISPEKMATCLSRLTHLKSLLLVLFFHSPQSLLDQMSQDPLPITLHVLPALTSFTFKGCSRYLEVLISRIDTPRLVSTDIVFVQPIFDTPRLRHFISHTEAFKTLHRADMRLTCQRVDVTLRQGMADDIMVLLGTSSDQLSSLAQICNSSLPLLPTLKRLEIHNGQHLTPRWQDDMHMESTQWLELFHPFIAVENIYLGEEIVPFVAATLQELTGERGTEVLPALQNIFVQACQSSGPVYDTIAQFVAARQLLGRPITIHDWDGQQQW